ncbi:replication protein RepA4 [Escherichia coli]|nr:replication protein RepA4 [Escherichia coli]
MIELLCAVGVVPTRVYPKSGRISALAGREGRLRACTRTSSQNIDSNDGL